MSSAQPIRPRTATVLWAATTSDARPLGRHQPCPEMWVTGATPSEYRLVGGVVDVADEAEALGQPAAPLEGRLAA